MTRRLHPAGPPTKHNEANGNDNADGTDDNRSDNHGVEGPTDDPQVLALRARQQRNLLATLLLSQGVPMLLGGDELGRTQGGNNNAYGQRGVVNGRDQELLTFTQALVWLRRTHPVFRRRGWFEGRPLHGADVEDVAWFRPTGDEMTDEDWQQHRARSLQVFLSGEGLALPDARGRRILDDTFLLLLNADPRPVDFSLPGEGWGKRWRVVLDTTESVPRWVVADDPMEMLDAGQTRTPADRSLVLLRCPDAGALP